jgi:plasmid stability protein
MPSITLKKIPVALHRILKTQAKRHKRSLTQEAISVLETGVGSAPKVDIEAMLERERRFRDSLKFTTTPEKIEAAIQKGRRI